MSNRARDEGGRFAEELSDQEILKLFDATNEAFLTAPEIAEEFEVTHHPTELAPASLRSTSPSSRIRLSR